MRVSGGWLLSGIAAVFVVVLVAVLTVTERDSSSAPIAALPTAAPADPLPRVKSQPLVFDKYAGKPRNDAVDSATASQVRARRTQARQVLASAPATPAPTPVSAPAAPASPAPAATPVRTAAPTTSSVPKVNVSPTASPKKSTKAKRRTVRPTFKRGLLKTKDVTIRITRYAVIAAGQMGNETGAKPVIALWYRTTNISGRKISPVLAILNFVAYQDNNPDAENKLEVGSLPDARFLQSQTENIKKGRTVENAMAYELDDLATPVDLVAIRGLDEKIGKTTYRLK